MSNIQNVFSCDSSRGESSFFKSLHPTFVATQSEFEAAFLKSTPRTLWLSSHVDQLFRFLVTMASHRQVSRPRAPILLAFESIESRQSTLVRSLFGRVVEAGSESYLPKEELAEVLASDHAADLMIGGIVDPKSEVITFVRGDLSLPLFVVPFSSFKPAADIRPNFRDFELTDYGQTIRFGKYEASVAALLYEFDPEFRRRERSRLLAREKSFGASLRRLRLQKSLTQADFPGITEKEIGRIERGEIKRPHQKTITGLAKTLGVRPEEIETF